MATLEGRRHDMAIPTTKEGAAAEPRRGQPARQGVATAAVNRYRADLREVEFVLFEQLGMQQVLGQGPFKDWGPDEVRMVLSEAYRFACEVSGPLHQIGDAEGCKLVDGQVKTPAGFKEAWKKLHEAGWQNLSAEAQYGAQDAPMTQQSAATEFISGSNRKKAPACGCCNLAKARFALYAFAIPDYINGDATPGYLRCDLFDSDS